MMRPQVLNSLAQIGGFQKPAFTNPAAGAEARTRLHGEFANHGEFKQI
jgi:hypothetical protein